MSKHSTRTEPSQDGIDIRDAHALHRSKMGTPDEQAAREYLEAVVARVKAKAGQP